MFQAVKMQLQHHRNTYIGSTCWKWRNTNGRRKSQSNQRIEDFSHIAIPLNQLKEKEEQKWTNEEQIAFKELKEKIITQLVLALPRKEEKFRVEVDTSEHAIGGILSITNGHLLICD